MEELILFNICANARRRLRVPMKRSNLLAAALLLIWLSLMGLEALDCWDRQSDIEEFEQQKDTTRKSEGRWAATRTESSVCFPLERGENGPSDRQTWGPSGPQRPSISLVGFGQRESTSEYMPPVHDGAGDRKPRPFKRVV